MRLSTTCGVVVSVLSLGIDRKSIFCQGSRGLSSRGKSAFAFTPPTAWRPSNLASISRNINKRWWKCLKLPKSIQMQLPSEFGSSSSGPATFGGTVSQKLDLELEEIKRYSRHLILSQVGMEGQRTLKASSVFCVGAGGLGSPLLLYLAAAGVGRLGIVDDDTVELSNLQRQVIHGQGTLGEAKVRSAERRIKDVNPHVLVDVYEEKMTAENTLRILAPYDVVVDGTDNFPTRYLINDACVILGKPLVYGAILRFEGQASVFNYRGGPTYRDLLPEPPAPGDVPSCAEGGVLGVLPGVIGCIQATETLKLLTGIGKPLSGRILIYNALDMTFRECGLQRDPSAPKITSLIDYDCFCGDQKGNKQSEKENASMAEATGNSAFQRISVKEARRRLEEDGWAPFVLDVRLPQEAEISKLPFSDLLCPHREVEKVAAQLPREQDILVYCKVGGRSAQACEKLAALGFTNLVNLDGGVIAWAKEIDARLPTY